jgi:hypothetical protein
MRAHVAVFEQDDDDHVALAPPKVFLLQVHVKVKRRDDESDDHQRRSHHGRRYVEYATLLIVLVELVERRLVLVELVERRLVLVELVEQGRLVLVAYLWFVSTTVFIVTRRRNFAVVIVDAAARGIGRAQLKVELWPIGRRQGDHVNVRLSTSTL